MAANASSWNPKPNRKKILLDILTYAALVIIIYRGKNSTTPPKHRGHGVFMRPPRPCFPLCFPFTGSKPFL